MMGGLDNWTSICFIICLFLIVKSSSAQKGFVSIACCADSDFTDTSTSIIWSPDDYWFPDRTGCHNITRPVVNYKVYGKVRDFEIESGGKRCYNLSTVKGQDYLVRGAFLYGDTVRAPLVSSFNVYIGVTPISLVNSSEDSVVEGLFRANNVYIDFCLVQNKGDPYISQIELRPVNDSEYLQGQYSYVLNLIARLDLGRSEDEDSFRYPDDPFDRIWKPSLSSEPTSSIISNNRTNILNQKVNVTVPFQVLRTALTDAHQLNFYHTDLDSAAYNYTINFYFLELNESVRNPGQRVFDIYINKERRVEGFDVLATGSNYAYVSLQFEAKGSLNLTLVKVSNASEFGPICNAYEILQMHSWVQGTNENDVKVIQEVRDDLKLQDSWSGDPCLPAPWDGLVCKSTNNGTTFITELDLSSRSLQGSIPLGITKLAYLEKLNLSYNGFTREIPPFSKSSLLISVDLSHNDLTGSLTESLSSLQHLRTLYYGCNPHLDKNLPPNLNNNSRLTTDNGVCGNQKSKYKGIIIGTVVGGSFLLTVAVGVALVCYQKKFDSHTKDGRRFPLTKNVVFAIHSTDDLVKSIAIQPFSLEYLERATQKYKTLIGEGGFGSVYQGTLADGQEVAVKVRSSTSTQGTREFENELNLLSAIRHENLVPLLGYCCENDQQILIYPFMSNGSLQDRLYGEAAKRKILDWPTRLSIAIGAARGLMYLHTFGGRSVIHRDVKSSNILLDQSMCAKVADFGFSKYAPQEGDSAASLEVRGTAGYLDPEYYSTQHLSAKSDVFSFGVVLLEIISGREPLNIHRPRNEWSLVEWAKPYIRESRIDEIVDPNIKGGYHAEAMWRMVEVALACIEPFSAYRPSMVDIVRELEDALIIENNASEYMKSIDSIGGYSMGGSNRFSVVMEKRSVQSTPCLTDASSVNTPNLALPEPR